MTYSIVACDRAAAPAPEWGVAVASKFPAVGSFVPWAEAGKGGIATQALANLRYISAGSELLARGTGAADVVTALVESDDDRDHRQLGVVDARGGAATFTGAECMDWAGGRTGDGYCCQGNILAGPNVVEDAAAAFEATEGELADRLLAALAAGEAAGGDRRGRQSAAIVVVRENGGYLGLSDRVVDLRVDDHADPIGELHRLWDVHRFYFPRPDTLEFVDIDDRLAAELRTLLGARGHDIADETGYTSGLRDALFDAVGMANLEERWSDEPRIERAVLDYLRSGTS
jgi:uncharacterized Ntn-hydrolase superfamily protein